MNLYEFEGKQLFEKHGIRIPRGVTIRRDDDARAAYSGLGISDVVVKAQVLSGKRGKNNGIWFCSSADEVVQAVHDLFAVELLGQHVAAVRIEEKIDIAEEHYVSISYDTNAQQPLLVYSADGGVDIEDVPEEKIRKEHFDIRTDVCDVGLPVAEALWRCFLEEDCRVAEINPLVLTTSGEWIAADAKVAIDDDAFFRHAEWESLEPRTMLGRPPTEREVAVRAIDSGEKYYQGTAGKYIELDGDIALILNGGGASIANMDALEQVGLAAANYTEYSGNPPREKVYELAKLVLAKPGIRGLWMCGVVANFTNMKETFLGIIDALDEMKPTYPIVVRRDGPESAEAKAAVLACAERNNLNMKLFDKETPMGETAHILAAMVAER